MSQFSAVAKNFGRLPPTATAPMTTVWTKDYPSTEESIQWALHLKYVDLNRFFIVSCTHKFIEHSKLLFIIMAIFGWVQESSADTSTMRIIFLGSQLFLYFWNMSWFFVDFFYIVRVNTVYYFYYKFQMQTVTELRIIKQCEPGNRFVLIQPINKFYP